MSAARFGAETGSVEPGVARSDSTILAVHEEEVRIGAREGEHPHAGIIRVACVEQADHVGSPGAASVSCLASGEPRDYRRFPGFEPCRHPCHHSIYC